MGLLGALGIIDRSNNRLNLVHHRAWKERVSASSQTKRMRVEQLDDLSWRGDEYEAYLV
jgi:hypothetical protein